MPLSKAIKRELQKELIYAAQIGNIEHIKICMKKGGDIYADADLKYSAGDTAMSTAIKHNQESTVAYLILQCGSTIDDVILAITEGNFNIGKLLLVDLSQSLKKLPPAKLEQLVAMLDGLFDADCIAMKNIIAIEKSNIREKLVAWIRHDSNLLTEEEIALIKAIPYVLHQNSGMTRDISNTFLLETISRDKTDIALQLIEMDREKKSLDIASACYMANNTPLVLALKRGNIAVSKALILAGADVNAKGFRNFSPLHWACILRLNQIIEVLLTYGADPQSKNAFGQQAIAYYLQDITLEDIRFYPTEAVLPGININMIDIVYDSNVIFQQVEDHRERSKHRFATKLPDYSDLYWHITGVLNNLGFVDYIIASEPGINSEDYFDLHAAAFSEIRNDFPILEALVDRINQPIFDSLQPAPIPVVSSHIFWQSERKLDNEIANSKADSIEFN